jgi:phosphopantetheinyl transferase
MKANLWFARCSDVTPKIEPAYLCLLNASERRRAEELLRPERRRQFLTGRVLLRRMLSAEFSRPIDEWRFVDHLGLPPRLVTSTSRPCAFSLSHSRDLVVCATVSNGSVGIDVEFAARHRNFWAISAEMRLRTGARQYEYMSPDEERAEFYRDWTLREAVVKVGLWNGTEWIPLMEDPAGARGSVLVGTTWENYSIAVAIVGGAAAPEYIGQVHTDGCVKLHRMTDWRWYGAERIDSVIAGPTIFSPVPLKARRALVRNTPRQEAAVLQNHPPPMFCCST